MRYTYAQKLFIVHLNVNLTGCPLFCLAALSVSRRSVGDEKRECEPTPPRAQGRLWKEWVPCLVCWQGSRKSPGRCECPGELDPCPCLPEDSIGWRGGGAPRQGGLLLARWRRCASFRRPRGSWGLPSTGMLVPGSPTWLPCSFSTSTTHCGIFSPHGGDPSCPSCLSL